MSVSFTTRAGDGERHRQRPPHDAMEVQSPPGGWARWPSILLWMVCAAACLALSFYVLTRARYSGQDSWLPMGRALDFLHGANSGSVYQTLFFSEHVKFQYPPASLLLIDLLRSIGIQAPEELNLLNAGVLIATGLVFAVFTVQVLGSIRWFGVQVPVGPLAFLAAIRFYPSNLAFQIGQMQILLGLLFLLACWAVLHERRGLAGSLIALAATVKPQFLPLGLLALWRRDWRFVIGLAAVTAASLVLSVGLYGWRTHLDYVNVLEFLSKRGEYQHLNQSVNGILVRWFYDGPSLDRDPLGAIPQSAFPPYMAAVYFPTFISSLLMLLTPFFVRARDDDRVSKLLEFCTASLLFTMASPIAWVHHYNILLPIYVVAIKAALERWEGTPAWIALGLLAVSLLLTGFPLVPASDPTMASLNLVQSHVFLGTLLLVVIMLVEMRTTVARHSIRQSLQAQAAS